jgi:hypothetical protein
MTDETPAPVATSAFLIEKGRTVEFEPPSYLVGAAPTWTNDVNAAIRFDTEDEARRAVAGTDVRVDVVRHWWVDGAYWGQAKPASAV